MESTCKRKAKVNSKNDLMFCGDVKHLIGKIVEVIKTTKSGLIQVKYQNELHSLPLKNLDEIGEKNDI
jgi:hypothetical protein